jgi:hypothetical protein
MLECALDDDRHLQENCLHWEEEGTETLIVIGVVYIRSQKFKHKLLQDEEEENEENCLD